MSLLEDFLFCFFTNCSIGDSLLYVIHTCCISTNRRELIDYRRMYSKLFMSAALMLKKLTYFNPAATDKNKLGVRQLLENLPVGENSRQTFLIH